MRRRFVWAAPVCAVVATSVFLLAGTTGAFAGGGDRHGLSKSDRELVAQASAGGQPYVTLLIGTQNGATGSVLDALQQLGGQVAFKSDALGYAEVRVAPDKADAAAKVAGILTANVDREVPAVVPSLDAGTPALAPVPNPGPVNPYMPTADIDAQQFVAAHPTWDGRGVKVGIVDTGVDLDRPELQTAIDARGKTVPKIYDWITTTQPRLDDAANGDPTWVPMSPATPAGSSIAIGTASYTLPAFSNNGVSLAVGTFHGGDSRLGVPNVTHSELDFVMPDPAHEDFGILEDTKSGTVWVDANQNHSFADDKPMKQYRVNYDVGHFGTDDPSTTNAVETMPFTVETDVAGYVNIGIISEGHGTHVAGTVAGKGFHVGGGTFDGVAPNAQLAVARVCLFITGCFTSDQDEAFIRLITEDKVDVIQMSIGGLPALNDGQSTSELLIDRLTKQYGVQFVFSMGNDGPGANTAGEPGTADLAIGVGAYQSQATWTANYGNTPPKADTLWAFSSRGPREDGGLKPQVVAPGSELSTWPGWDPGITEASARPYNLPPGYGMIQGTSMASPMVAGSVALLLSAAQQSNLNQVSPAQIRKALFSSARYLNGYASYEQGNGLVQVDKAWDILRTDPGVVSISSTAPVKTAISDFLVTPNTGVGLYEREGWTVGQSGTRTITFTRDAPQDEVGDDDLGARNKDRGAHEGQGSTFNASLRGDDGTFSLASSSVSLPHGGTASVDLSIHPTTPGIHSALVVLDDPSSPGIEYETEATIVAAAQFSAANNYTVTASGSSDRAGYQAYFVNVAPGTPALKVDLSVTNNGRARIDAFDPWGLPVSPTSAAFVTGPGTVSRTFANPKPGVWEIDIEASRAAVPDQSTFTLNASELGVTIVPASWNIASAQQNVGQTQAFTFTNLFGAFTGGSSGTVFGSAHDARPTISTGQQQQVPINVETGSTRLTVSIGNTSDTNADLDLYLFNCTSGTCVAAGQSAGSSANETVTVNNPAAGKWVALVDGFATPSGSTAYDYEDVLAEPGLGDVTTVDPAAPHPNGSSWNATATATATAVPATGRILKGFVQVKSGSTVLGSAPVTVQSVTP